MPEYLKTDTVIDALRNCSLLTKAGKVAALLTISSLPDAEVATVRHGIWEVYKEDYSAAVCSACGEVYDTVDWTEDADEELWKLFAAAYRYCPSCGAKMDGK